MAILSYGQVGWRSAAVAPSGCGYADTDVCNFITTAAITNTTQQNAINTLVTDLKGYGIWSKMKAIYPFVGGTAAQHRFNLKLPTTNTSDFYGTFIGGGTHSSTGYLPNGSTGYMNTNLTPSAILGQNSTHVSYYSRTNNTSGGVDIGTRNATATLTCILNDTDSKIYFRVNRSAGTAQSLTTIADSRLFYIINRTSSTQELLFTNSTKNTFSANSTGLSTFPVFLGSLNDSGVAKFFGTKECAFASIGEGLTDTEASNLYAAVQKFQTTLGRQV
jgi:hypothetical protein